MNTPSIPELLVSRRIKERFDTNTPLDRWFEFQQNGEVISR
jgi:hypothetical protein